MDLNNNIYKHNNNNNNTNNNTNKTNTTPIFMPSLLSPHTTTTQPLTNQHPYTGHTTGEVDGRDPLLVTSKGHMTSK